MSGQHSGGRQHNRPRQNNEVRLERLSAPYRFVPVQPKVFYPEWQNVSQDKPMDNGYCGTLSMDISSHSPLLPAVSAESKEGTVQKPFQLPDNTYAIPGSTLRGMIRNVVEIASCAKMKFIDDKRMSVRDLTSGARPFYGNKLTVTKGRNRYQALSKAGWLTFDGRWRVTPCEYGRVEHSDINRHLDKGIDKRARPPAKIKYQSWMRKHKALSVGFECGQADWHDHSRGKQLKYRKASRLQPNGDTGHLVFTGQPGPNKHMEFVFFDQAVDSIDIDERVVQGFMDIYSGTDEWKCLLDLKEKGELPGIPVFYLGDSNSVDSLGLAMMYKLAYKHTAKSLVDQYQANEQSEDTGAPRFDLAELIFGSVDELDGKNSLKGRVSFSHAVCTDTDVVTEEQDATILNGPKPSYFPHYVRQSSSGGSPNTTEKYKTLMDDAEISGWKRYQVHNSPRVQKLTGDQQKNKKVQVRLCPIVSKPKFAVKLRFHNLNEIEVGALLWAIEWGGRPELRHSVGMGKPFGFGQISLQVNVEKSEVISNDLDQDFLEGQAQKTDFLGNCRAGYRELMNDFFSDWQNYVDAFCETANPDHGDQLLADDSLSYMSLGKGPRENRFVIAKNNMMFLPTVYGNVSSTGDAVSAAPKPSVPNSPSQQWIQDAIEQISDDLKVPQKEKIWFQKALAVAWAGIDEPDLKQSVLKDIQEHWKQNGGWESAKGSRGKAFEIYNGADSDGGSGD